MTIQSGLFRSYRRSGLDRSVANTQPFLRAFISSTILLLVARWAEHLFFGAGYFSTLALHPFWIIVLLAAFQDGVFVGVSVAAMAALMMDWPPRPMGIDITTHYISVAILPLQWLLASLFIGLFRQAEIGRERRLESENADLLYTNQALADEVHDLDEALTKSQLLAVTRPGGVQSQPRFLMDKLLTLLDANVNDLGPAFREAAEMFSAHSASIFFTKNGRSFGVFGDASEVLSDIALPAKATETLMAELEANDAPLVITSDQFRAAPGAKYLVVAGLYPRKAKGATGAIILQADSLAEANVLAKAAELLATLIGTAMGKHADIEPQRIVKFPSHKVLLQPRTESSGG